MSESDSGAKEGLSDTANRLRSALGSPGDEDGSSTDEEGGLEVLPTNATGGDSNGDDTTERQTTDAGLSELTDLTERAEGILDDLANDAEGGESNNEGDPAVRSRIDRIDDLLRVVDEAEDVLSTIDLSTLLEAVDLSELPRAIEMGEVPAAIRERNPKRAIQYRKLLKVIDFRTILGSVDLSTLRSEKGEFDEAFEGATGGSVGDVLGGLGGDGGDGEEDEGSGLGSEIMDDLGGGMGTMSAMADEGEAIPSDLMQDQIQSKINDAVEGFRDSALEARDNLKGMRDKTKEEVEEKTGGTAGQPSSLNPTAYSSMQSFESRVDMHSNTRFSTIPRTAWHSTASGRDRMYGDRFDNAEGSDDSEEENQ